MHQSLGGIIAQIPGPPLRVSDSVGLSGVPESASLTSMQVTYAVTEMCTGALLS